MTWGPDEAHRGRPNVRLPCLRCLPGTPLRTAPPDSILGSRHESRYPTGSCSDSRPPQRRRTCAMRRPALPSSPNQSPGHSLRLSGRARHPTRRLAGAGAGQHLRHLGCERCRSSRSSPGPLGAPLGGAARANPRARKRHKAPRGMTSASGPWALFVRLRPTLPHRHQCSTIGAEGLSFRVRNGAGRFPFAMTAETLWRYRRSRPYLGNHTVDA